METYQPKVSIITVCLNSEKFIEDTILSVREQTYKNIEKTKRGQAAFRAGMDAGNAGSC